MVRLTPRFRERSHAEIQNDMVRHSAWHLSKDGRAAPRPFHIKTHLVIFAFIAIDFMIPGQVLIVHGGYGPFLDRLSFFLLFVAGYAIWLAAPLYLDGPNRLAGLILTFVYVPLLCLGVAFSTVSAIPKLGVLFATQHKVVEAQLCRVHIHSSSSPGIVRYLSPRQGRYAFDFAAQPLFDYLDHSDRGYRASGFSGSYFGVPTSAFVSGPANWFGIRAEHISKTGSGGAAANAIFNSDDPAQRQQYRDWVRDNCYPPFV